MVYGIIITRYLSRKYQKLSQSFVKVLLHSVVQEASVRIGIKGSWRLWFGKWVLYFIECYVSYIRSLKYSGLWHWVRKYVVTWPGQSATSVQWRLWNFAQLLMSRVLFFSSINISSLSNDENSNDFHWINNNMSFVNSYKNHYQITYTWVSYRLAKKVTPMKMTRFFFVYLSLAATSRMSEAFSSHVPYQWKLLKFAFLLISIWKCMRHC